jgi:glycine cleavage system regulatory protein
MATAEDVRDLLAETSMPADLVDELLAGASATWLMGESADVLAADLALCHPALAEGEVRAAVSEAALSEAALHEAAASEGAKGSRARLTVVAPDRPGVLASIADALSAHLVTVSSVRGTAWSDPPLALLSLMVQAGPGPVPWDAIGEELRAALRGGRDRPMQFRPTAPVQVTASPQDAGRSLVTVDAPDQLELLWAAARWFEDGGGNIEAASIDSTGARFHGTFLVAGPPLDAADLAAALGGAPVQRPPGRAARVLARTGMAAGGLGAAVAWRHRRNSRRK